MRYSNHGWFQQQMSFLRRQFLQDGDLPFSDVLSDGLISHALTAINACWVDRIFTPLVTLWVFLGQVLNADQSCRAAVARLIAHRLAKGQALFENRTSVRLIQENQADPQQFGVSHILYTACRVQIPSPVSLIQVAHDGICDVERAYLAVCWREMLNMACPLRP